MKWPRGFICPSCGHDRAYNLHCRNLGQCCLCHKQTSITSGTLFHGTHIPLLKWFWAMFFVGSDKGSISALRLSKLIDVNWRTARLILSKLRHAMGHRDSMYRLSGTIELDDALVGGKHKGVRGRGTLEKSQSLSLVKLRGKKQVS
jgi:hypothetical protein